MDIMKKDLSIDELSEAHSRGGEYIRDVVFSANDGLITTFAVVAGVAAAAGYLVGALIGKW